MRMGDALLKQQAMRFFESENIKIDNNMTDNDNVMDVCP